MTTRPEKDGQAWTRDDLILAFDLYCRIPFKRTKSTEPQVRSLASMLGRTPASVARKLGNFGAFDPSLAARNITGLSHGSKLDRQIWDEFHADWGELVVLAAELRDGRVAQADRAETIRPPDGPSETLTLARCRLHQTFFRDAVLSSYEGRCCVTGLPLPECLVAGHIVPWSEDEGRRADPTNGLCMSATFDRLFEAGLITLQDDLTLTACDQLLAMDDDAVVHVLRGRHGRVIAAPARFRPDPTCLRWHREHRFRLS
jgi:putative restriction endonuclease